MTDTLAAFERSIASAESADEPALFAEALSLVVRGDAAPVERWIAVRAFAEAAIHLHRLALPNCGFQFGRIPARGTGLASSWRHGDHSASPFTAATPALALLRATVHEAARTTEAETRGACATCHGLGWYVTRANRKQICAHG